MNAKRTDLNSPPTENDLGDIDAILDHANATETDAAPPAITFAPQQVAAIDAVAEWHDDWTHGSGVQVFRLFGYAGAGKTTIAREIARRIQEAHPEKGVLFGAYTGKAASVLRAKGCPANTIHGLIYKPEERSKSKKDDAGNVLKDANGRDMVERETVFHLRGGALRANTTSLVVIDECSMVGEKIGRDLLSFGVPILVLGDPAQLPPVGDGGFFTNGQPNVLLTEIHRQKDGCGILDIATTIRTLGCSALRYGVYDESAIEPMSRLFGMDPFGFDQLIVGKNATRRAWNQKMRARLGRNGMLPVPGDRLICLRNNHGLGLMNGEQVRALACTPVDDETMQLAFEREDGRVHDVRASLHYFAGRDGNPPWSGEELLFFDYGYAITCHKAQGSQFDRVLVIDESRVFKEDAAKWLYTAVTRAAQHVTVVR